MEFQINKEQLQEIFNFYQQPESIIALPDRTSVNQAEKNRPQKKRPANKRILFSMEQKQRLEEEYYKTKGFIDRTERFVLAKELDVPEQKVKIWFQNKRMRAKRKARNSLCQRSPNTIPQESTVFSFNNSFFETPETSFFDNEDQIPESPSWDSDGQTLSPISSVTDEEIHFNFELAEDFIQNDVIRGFANQNLNFYQQQPQFDVLETLEISHFEQVLQLTDQFF